MEVLNIEVKKKRFYLNSSDALIHKLNANGYRAVKLKLVDGLSSHEFYAFLGADTKVCIDNIRNILTESTSVISDLNLTPRDFMNGCDKVAIQDMQSKLLLAYNFCNINVFSCLNG